MEAAPFLFAAHHMIELNGRVSERVGCFVGRADLL